MEETLAAFIAANEPKPWAPGAVDCCMVLASWAIWLGHSDPAQHLRGSYSTELGFQKLIEAAGGATAIVGACVSAIHGTRVAEPLCGSIGVLGSPSNIHRQFGAIFDGSRWMVRTKNGFTQMSAKPLEIWMI